ncbi:rho gtpase activation protein [Anaeramoeba flamelloides]|uniref:Rho gtpase activation protein n=1 Tax=Anaeramoeba flamelloides TaxID=1746091 RepID=A0AAV7Y531_9EUKA|nr:rho gtpase activation protein [Anaeramoeba flamelloides]
MVYMGDIHSNTTSDLKAILGIIKIGLQLETLRDEIFVQVVKQTTKNPNKNSKTKDWDAFCVLTQSFLPLKNFQSPLIQHFEKHTRSTNRKIRAFARYALRVFRSILNKKIYEMPKIVIIKIILQLPFRPVVFGVSLEQLLESEKTTGSKAMIPRVLKYLYQNIE